MKERTIYIEPDELSRLLCELGKTESLDVDSIEFRYKERDEVNLYDICCQELPMIGLVAIGLTISCAMHIIGQYQDFDHDV